MGTDDAASERLAPETDHPSSVAKRTLRRHTPKVGAVCGKAACTVLCGGALSNGRPYRVARICANHLLHLLTTGFGTQRR